MHVPSASPLTAALVEVQRSMEERPGITGKEIASRLGIAPATISYRLRMMREAGPA